MLAAALDLKVQGDLAAADEKLAGALRADPEHAEAYYLQAGLRGAQGDAAGAAGALDGYVKLDSDVTALGARVEEDADFDRVRSTAEFKAWMQRHGLVKAQAKRAPGKARTRPTAPRPKAAAPAQAHKPAPAAKRPVKAPPKKKGPEPEKVDGLGLDLDI